MSTEDYEPPEKVASALLRLGYWAGRVEAALARWIARHKDGIRWFVFLVLSVAALVTVWWLPKNEIQPWRLHLKAAEQLAAEDAVRRTIAQIVGAAFVLVGLYLTWQNVVINREGRITERFSKAIDQLGSSEVTVALGGIYALERISRDSERDHGTIVEVLCAFVRERTREPSPEDRPRHQLGSIGSLLPSPRSPLSTVQAACNVLGRRRWHAEGNAPDLPKVHLEGVELLGGAHWENAFLYGAHFEHAALHGIQLTNANLEHATLDGAVLNRASLHGARLKRASLKRARLIEASLVEADLDGADLKDARLIGAYLRGANLDGAHLEGASLLKARGLTIEQIRNAIIDEKTALPAEIKAALEAIPKPPAQPAQ
jgi:hypothetical protein